MNYNQMPLKIINLDGLFKPFMILSILQQIDQGDILLYLDVNDKPLCGIKSI